MNPRNDWPHRFVVIEGVIGVGKTSLARRLAEAVGAEAVLEEAGDNPFLERFYKDPRSAAFPAQLHFLFQRCRQLQGLRQQDLFAPLRVADYLLEKDRLFARVNLDDEEFALYRQVYERMAFEAPRPDLVVFLQAPVEVLQERIARRGIRYEQGIRRDYLERLQAAYTRYFHEYCNSPLLIVNAAGFDPVNDAVDFGELYAAMERTRRGRHYFNPPPGNLQSD